mgnify:CR=1 FL=1
MGLREGVLKLVETVEQAYKGDEARIKPITKLIIEILIISYTLIEGFKDTRTIQSTCKHC